ncbi:Modification methylase FokI [subsurface metagenome]
MAPVQLKLFEKTVNINNRKYIGAKYRLLEFIAGTILAKAGKIGTFIDGFAGTGVVGNHFRKYSDKIISNDILFSNFVINKAFLNSTEENVSINRVSKLLNVLNNSKGLKGYVYDHYGGSYFTHPNAALIDAVREGIESFYLNGECSLQEKYVLLTSLIFAMDKAANTVGQYDAFLKHIGTDSHDPGGRHVIDSNVYKPVRLKLPALRFGGSNEAYNEDINDLIQRVSGEVLYLDPPYNSRQYIDCYHVLENIVKWEKPVLFGKTRKFKRDGLKSRYSRKAESVSAFRELIAAARVDHVFLSYNNEGIQAGVSKRRAIKERLFYCRVKK